MQRARPVSRLTAAAMLLIGINVAQAADLEYSICNDFLPEPRSVLERPVGPESCLMLQADVAYNDRDYVRVDMGLDGTAEGYVTMDGTYHEYLTNSPDLIFEQAGTPGERYLAIARYERLRGSAVLHVAEVGRGLERQALGHGTRSRPLVSQRQSEDLEPLLRRRRPGFDVRQDRARHARQGLCVSCYHNRTSEQDIGEIIAELEDGSIVDFAAFNDNASLIKDFTLVAENAIEGLLGRKPSHTFLYGHSAGARIARSINYTPGLNENADGEILYDGYLMDDSATGLWFPVIMRGGRDVLFVSDEEKATFRPQVELIHQMYTKVWERAPDRAPWITRGYLPNKRINAKIVMDKGLGDRFRMYEIRSMSHNGGEGLPPDNRIGKALVLDISLIIGGAIDKLEALVAGSTETLASKSDWHVIGDVDDDGILDNPAITYPEVACPLGIFYPYPQSGSGVTAFAAFTGGGLEPLDGADVFVDMNRNGVWDFRETPTQAWRRLGLLSAGETLTHSHYVECVQAATKSLQDDGFFTAATAARYVDEARARSINPADLVE